MASKRQFTGNIAKLKSVEYKNVRKRQREYYMAFLFYIQPFIKFIFISNSCSFLNISSQIKTECFSDWELSGNNSNNMYCMLSYIFYNMKHKGPDINLSKLTRLNRTGQPEASYREEHYSTSERTHSLDSCINNVVVTKKYMNFWKFLKTCFFVNT